LGVLEITPIDVITDFTGVTLTGFLIAGATALDEKSVEQKVLTPQHRSYLRRIEQRRKQACASALSIPARTSGIVDQNLDERESEASVVNDEIPHCDWVEGPFQAPWVIWVIRIIRRGPVQAWRQEPSRGSSLRKPMVVIESLREYF
jgi:hypothetical protein